jgi:hypothetical protein
MLIQLATALACRAALRLRRRALRYQPQGMDRKCRMFGGMMIKPHGLVTVWWL